MGIRNHAPTAVIMTRNEIVSFEDESTLKRCVSVFVGIEFVVGAIQHVADACAIEAEHAGAAEKTPSGSFADRMSPP